MQSRDWYRLILKIKIKDGGRFSGQEIDYKAECDVLSECVCDIYIIMEKLIL